MLLTAGRAPRRGYHSSLGHRTSVVAGPGRDAQGRLRRQGAPPRSSSSHKPSGLALVQTPAVDPLAIMSLGTGQLVVAALEEGCRDITIVVGENACTDGGFGRLQALGTRLVVGRGDSVEQGVAALESLQAVDFSTRHPALPDSRIRVAGDLTIHSSALKERLRSTRLNSGGSIRPRQARTSAVHLGGQGHRRRRPRMARCAGGRGPPAGWGSLDAHTLHGKAPAGVAPAAGDKAVPVVAVGGGSTLSPEHRPALGLHAVYTVADLEPDRMAACPTPTPLARSGSPDRRRTLG